MWELVLQKDPWRDFINKTTAHLNGQWLLTTTIMDGDQGKVPLVSPPSLRLCSGLWLCVVPRWHGWCFCSTC